MKRLLYEIVLSTACLTILAIVLVGCEVKPAQEDVTKDTNWGQKAEGKLTEFKKIRGKDCTHKKVGNWCSADYYFLIDDTKQFVAGKIARPELIKVGSVGKLYKYGNNHRDDDSWFRWVMDESPPVDIEVALTPAKEFSPDKETQEREREYKEFREHMELIAEKPVWEQYNSVIKPSPDVPVFVKLDDGTITVAHLNERGEWKLETNRRKTLGGPSINDVDLWKKFDIN